MTGARLMRWSGSIVGLLLLATASCGGSASSDDKVETIQAALRHRHAPPPSPPPPPSSNMGGSSGTGGGSSGGSNADAIIKAAQTPDGQAIPQAAVNGVCPPVVQLLGFWSCPTIGQTCSSTSPVRHCACSRTDGEGQNPTWICN